VKKLLVINASARKEHSHSRTLTDVFINHWTSAQQDVGIQLRELGSTHVPHLSEEWIIANQTPASNRTEKHKEVLSASDAYIKELREADVIVLGTPMYNWSIPSSLKAYIDQVLRLNETFKINTADPAKPYTGLLQNKKLVLLVATGIQGYEPGQPNAHLNFQTTYLETVFGMMGIEDIHVVRISGTSLDKEALKGNIEQAYQQVRSFVKAMEWQRKTTQLKEAY